MPKKFLLLGFGLIAACVFIFYSNSYTVSFQFDDTHTVQSNIYVRSLKYIPQYFVDAKTFSYRPENSGYRPMTTTALALGFALSKLNTWGYHLIKLIEHTIMGLMLFLVGLRLLPTSNRLFGESWVGRYLVALFAAMIFVSHRANTETVNYISAISTLQAGMFFMIAFYLYLLFRAKNQWAYLIVSAICYLLSMFSKEEGVTLPAMLFFYELIYRRQSGTDYLTHFKRNYKNWIKYVGPYVLTAMLFIVLRTVIQPSEADTSRGNTPVYIYFITQFRSWLYYWKLFFWPVTLNADNLAFEFSTTFFDERVIGSLIIHLILWTTAFRNRVKNPFVTFAIIWMYITVLPASSFFPLVEAVTEHRMYIPFVFLSLLVVYKCVELFARFLKKKETSLKVATVSIVFCLIVSLLGYGTYARTQVWQTPVTLWEDVISKNPNSPRAMNVLAVGYLNERRYDKALPVLERCQAVAQAYLPCKVHLGLVYAQMKQYDKGLEALKAGLAVDPQYVHLNFHIGIYYKEYFGDYTKAREHFKIVEQRTSGRLFHATLKLAEMDLDEGKYMEGMRGIETVLKLDEGNAEAWELYAKGHMLLGNLPQARELFQKLISNMPNSPRAWLNLGNLEERSNNLAEAKADYERALGLDMSLIQAWQALYRLAEKKSDKPAMEQFKSKIAELKSNRSYTFMQCSFLIGEKPRQVEPN